MPSDQVVAATDHTQDCHPAKEVLSEVSPLSDLPCVPQGGVPSVSELPSVCSVPDCKRSRQLHCSSSTFVSQWFEQWRRRDHPIKGAALLRRFCPGPFGIGRFQQCHLRRNITGYSSESRVCFRRCTSASVAVWTQARWRGSVCKDTCIYNNA